MGRLKFRHSLSVEDSCDDGSVSYLMSAQLGFLSEAGSHKSFDERSALIFVREDPGTGATNSAVNDLIRGSKGVSGFRV